MNGDAWAALLMALFVVLGLVFLLLAAWWVTPGPYWRRWPVGIARLRAQWPLFVAGLGLAAFHGLNVNIIDPWIRPRWEDLTGVTFTRLALWLEGEVVRQIAHLHTTFWTFVWTWFYLVIHHAIVVGAPIYLVASGERGLGRRLMVSYFFVYLFALPGWWLLPIDNPTVWAGGTKVLEQAIPRAEEVFYRGTTIDNTWPSLHVGLAFLVWLHLRRSSNQRLRSMVVWYAPLVVVSILYLQVHWFSDVPAGLVVAVAAALAAGALLDRRENKDPRHRARWFTRGLARILRPTPGKVGVWLASLALVPFARTQEAVSCEPGAPCPPVTDWVSPLALLVQENAAIQWQATLLHAVFFAVWGYLASAYIVHYARRLAPGTRARIAAWLRPSWAKVVFAAIMVLNLTSIVMHAYNGRRGGLVNLGPTQTLLYNMAEAVSVLLLPFSLVQSYVLVPMLLRWQAGLAAFTDVRDLHPGGPMPEDLSNAGLAVLLPALAVFWYLLGAAVVHGARTWRERRRTRHTGSTGSLPQRLK